MEAGQSDIKNKTLAPVFKKLGIIEQWGNGLQLIAEELKKYSEIKMIWSEPGIGFRITFLKSDYEQSRPITNDWQKKLPQELKVWLNEGIQKEKQEIKQELRQELRQETEQETLFLRILSILLTSPKSRKDISLKLGQKSISGGLNKILTKLRNLNLIERTIKDNPNSPKQKLKLTKRGLAFYVLSKDTNKNE